MYILAGIVSFLIIFFGFLYFSKPQPKTPTAPIPTPISQKIQFKSFDISGTIKSKQTGGQTGRLSPISFTPKSPNNINEAGLINEGDYSVELADPDGKLLKTFYFKPVRLASDPDPDPNEDVSGFGFYAPIMDNVNTATLKFKSLTLDRLQKTPNAPEIKIISPPKIFDKEGNKNLDVKFEITDKDGDKITYNSWISSDGSQSWRPYGTYSLAKSPLTHGIKNSLINMGFKAGENLILLIASDGLNSSYITLGPFKAELPPEKPEVSIYSPKDGAKLQKGNPVILMGTGHYQDELLPDSNLIWTSDKQGFLGNGHTVELEKVLNPGKHLITLTGKSNNGLQASQTITITVDSP